MGLTMLHLLCWLLAACPYSAQELLRVSVSPKVSAVCGQQVVLTCNVSSSQQGLQIRSMEWYQNQISYCSFDKNGEITTHHRQGQSDFRCEYHQERLSLIFEEVRPWQIGNSEPFMCEVKSNKGVKDGKTTVEIQECGYVQGGIKDGYPTCSFTHVYPGGDVHWFDGSHHLGHGNTSEHVEDGGWLTIQNYLDQNNPDMTYNCSLRSSRTGRHINSTLVMFEKTGISASVHSGAGYMGTRQILLFVPVFLVVMLM